MSETQTNHQRQLEREKRQVALGVERYQKEQDRKEETDMRPGQVLVKRAVEPLVAAIDALVAETKAGAARSGRPALATRYLQNLQSEPVAYITARIVIDAACQQQRLPKVAMKIAALINDHYVFDELRVAEPKLAHYMEMKAQKWSTPHHRRSIMSTAADSSGVSGLSWKAGDKLHLGVKLVELFITSTGLAEQVLVSEGRNNTQYQLRLTPPTAQWLLQQHSRCELMEPRYMPMVVPPVPWSSPVKGGYFTRENRLDLIRNCSPELRDDLMSMDLHEIYTGLNTLQRTAWSINRAVYTVMSEAWRCGMTVGDLPDREFVEIPERPADIPASLPVADMDTDTLERFNVWRRSAAQGHDHNASLISKRRAVDATLMMAEDVLAEKQFWFPHNLDFREREYCVVSGLSPQSNDVGKSLLQFAEGKPLGEHGAYWLQVHIANLFGIDKCSFDERAAWTDAHCHEIMDSGMNPLNGEKFWTQADEPWQALAACIEYTGYMLQGTDYVSYLPIAMDGSCSGVQHFSAMLLDKPGATAVNLTPSDDPHDLYSTVSDAVSLRLNDPALATDQLAQAWKGKVVRAIAKTPCMTFAYSVTSRGIRDQILTQCDKLGAGSIDGQYLPGYSNFVAATYLAPIMEQAIRDTVSRAAEAMDWLKDTVRTVVAADIPVLWFTPTGFPVAHRYQKSNGKRYSVWFQGLRMRFQLRVETARQDTAKNASAIAPNFVHSLDAAHLVRVVTRMSEITKSFACIHDSFGVHACDVDELHYALRDEFVKLYSTNQLEDFREQMLSRLPSEFHEKILPVPDVGDLDLPAVMQADFFFN